MRRLLIVISLILLFLLGLKSLILQFPFEWPKERYAEILASVRTPVRYLLAMLVMALPVLVGIDVWMRHPSRRKLALKGREGGRLELRQAVIEKIVRQSVSELPEIEKIRVFAASARGGLRVKILVKARDVRSVPDLDEAIRQRADQSLRRVLGIEEIQTVDVSLEDMSSFERSSPGVGEFKAPTFPPARTTLAPEPEPPQGVFISSEEQHPVRHEESVVLRPPAEVPLDEKKTESEKNQDVQP